MDVLWGFFCHVVSDWEVLLASPYLLDLMDIRAHEASRGGHVLEGVGDIVGLLVVRVGAAYFEICPPSHLDKFSLSWRLPSGSPWGDSPVASTLSVFGGVTLWEWCLALQLLVLVWLLPRQLPFGSSWGCWHLWHCRRGSCWCQFPAHCTWL